MERGVISEGMDTTRTTLRFTLPASLRLQVEAAAKAKGISLSQFITRHFERKLARRHIKA